jgi:hypothetical protein
MVLPELCCYDRGGDCRRSENGAGEKELRGRESMRIGRLGREEAEGGGGGREEARGSEEEEALPA